MPDETGVAAIAGGGSSFTISSLSGVMRKRPILAPPDDGGFRPTSPHLGEE
ncbi:MAG: hypothetical protein R3C11_28090 [Planctomycetaceae bacterium]